MGKISGPQYVFATYLLLPLGREEKRGVQWRGLGGILKVRVPTDTGWRAWRKQERK